MLRETFRNVAAWAVLISLCLCPAAVRAQFDTAPPGTVSGTGTESVKQKPTLLRMTIQLQEKEKSIQEALGKLKDRRDAAMLQLQSMGAAKSAISVTEPTLSSGQSDQQRQMQQMLIRQMRSRGRAPKALQVPESVTVSSTLTAEWPLTMQSNEELLVFANTLQSKIEAADLAGLKEPKELTPQEEELQAEMEEMMSGYGGYGSEQPQPGKPAFLYVARISDDQRNQALAAAFDKAKAQASSLAAAAGAKLGQLSSLSGATGQAEQNYDYGNYAMRMAMAQSAVATADEGEAMVAAPGMVTFQVMVNATFRLE